MKFRYLRDHFREQNLFLNRSITFIVIVVIGFAVLLSRLIFLQIYQYDNFHSLAINNQIRVTPMVPIRGNIYDRNGLILAENKPIYNLDIVPVRTKNLKQTLDSLSAVINLSEHDIEKFYKKLKLKRRFENVTLKSRLTELEVASLALNKYKFPEMEITATLSRHYPYKELFSHLIGYVGPVTESDLNTFGSDSNYKGTEYVGKIGLEKKYENVLHGNVGYKHVETNAKGQLLRTFREQLPDKGSDLYLNIDLKLQQKVYDSLEDLKGAIIVLDPTNGEVLAFVSKPGFEPNLFVQGISKTDYEELRTNPDRPLFNRIINGMYPPASTIKPLVAIQALEQNVISTKSYVFDAGWFTLPGEYKHYRCHKRTGHGAVNMQSAISCSCDTYFYTISHRLGIDKIQDIFLKFGLGKPTGIDLDGESVGLVPSREWKKRVKRQPWYPGETIILGIGQGFLLSTPLQMVDMVSVIANHGVSYEPRLVNQVRSSHNVKAVNTVVNNTVKLQSDAFWDEIIKAMQGVITGPSGTARRISEGLKYPFAAKTGTAQVFSLKRDKKEESQQKQKLKVADHLRDHLWFVGFAPADKPKVAICVLVENGGKSPSVIARNIVDYYLGVTE